MRATGCIWNDFVDRDIDKRVERTKNRPLAARTVPIRNADGMFLDSSDNELYIIVRYKGDPTPINDITLTFS